LYCYSVPFVADVIKHSAAVGYRVSPP